jgi:hypothetical protein
MEKAELDKLTKLVDDFVAQLKKDLLVVQYKPTTTGVLPGVWDKMKNWWYNSVLKKGGNDTNNPYVYKNKFGALGHEDEDDAKKESSRLTLHQYNFIKEQYNKLESDLSFLNEEVEAESENLKKLKLWRIIDGWAGKFKQAIINQFSGSVEPESPKPTEAAPPAEDATATGTAPMDAPPSGPASSGEPKRGRGRPKLSRISWNKDGWGPKTEDGKLNLPENSINWIKKKVFNRLNEKKKDHPNFEETFSEDFEKVFKKILSDNEEELKSHPNEVLEVEKTKNKWEGFLASHTAERLHLILVSRDLGLE